MKDGGEAGLRPTLAPINSYSFFFFFVLYCVEACGNFRSLGALRWTRQRVHVAGAQLEFRAVSWSGSPSVGQSLRGLHLAPHLWLPTPFGSPLLSPSPYPRLQDSTSDLMNQPHLGEICSGRRAERYGKKQKN